MSADALEPTGVRAPHGPIRSMLGEMEKEACRAVIHRVLSDGALPDLAAAYSRWTHADCPMPMTEMVTVNICSESVPGASAPKEVFALYVDLDADTPPSLKRWRAEADGVDRHVQPREGVIVDEPDICAGIGAPRVVLLDRDVTRLVMSAAAFERQTRLREQALAKLTRDERAALGV